MENPYQSPVESGLSGPAPIAAGIRQPGLVRHVRVVATLVLIQGILELLAGLFLVFATCGILMMPRHWPDDSPQPDGFWMVSIIYGALALIVLTAACLHITAGWQNRRFRGRTLGIIAMVGGMATLFTCYCLPTAVAVGVYGLIVLLNHEVTEAFYMGEAGHSPQDILAAFAYDPDAALASPFAASFSPSDNVTPPSSSSVPSDKQGA